MQTPSAVAAFLDGLPDLNPEAEDQVVVVLVARRPNTKGTDGNLWDDATGLPTVLAPAINALEALEFPRDAGSYVHVVNDQMGGGGSFTDYAQPTPDPEA